MYLFMLPENFRCVHWTRVFLMHLFSGFLFFWLLQHVVSFSACFCWFCFGFLYVSWHRFWSSNTFLLMETFWAVVACLYLSATGEKGSNAELIPVTTDHLYCFRYKNNMTLYLTFLPFNLFCITFLILHKPVLACTRLYCWLGLRTS